MRNKFEEQLTLLNSLLIEMAAMVKEAISSANKALIAQDGVLAQHILDSDDSIDEKEEEIAGLCLRIILQQQPVARDLRLVSSVLKMITDLERIGDHASDISEITLLLANEKYIKKLETIPQMSEVTTKMVTDSIEALVKQDIELARNVITRDDIVDDLFVEVRNDLVALINENAKNGEQAIDLIMIAKYFERIGDHATNIAEWVIFSLTGVHKSSQIM
jgi:phosphate transport system protein